MFRQHKLMAIHPKIMLWKLGKRYDSHKLSVVISDIWFMVSSKFELPRENKTSRSVRNFIPDINDIGHSRIYPFRNSFL